MTLNRLVGFSAALIILSACQSPAPIGSLPADNNVPAPHQSTANVAQPHSNTTGPVNAPEQDDGVESNSIDQSVAFSTTSPTTTGAINHPQLSEVSGLASSTRRSNTLWAINDSGNAAKLFALGHTGKSLGSFNVSADNRDWEDLASAWINGESYLLIADIGDNRLAKDEHAIYIVPEPILDNRAVEPLVPAHILRFRYPDGAHDAEAMAYADGWVYVLSKEPQVEGKRQASQAYRIPLDLSQANQLLLAEKIADLSIPSYSLESSLIASLSGLDISQPTAFDIDAQNRYAYLLTYRTVYRYKRESDESWAQVLAKPRERVHTHSLSQAEALAVDANGIVWFTSEKRPAPIWALPAAR